MNVKKKMTIRNNEMRKLIGQAIAEFERVEFDRPDLVDITYLGGYALIVHPDLLMDAVWAADGRITDIYAAPGSEPGYMMVTFEHRIGPEIRQQIRPALYVLCEAFVAIIDDQLSHCIHLRDRNGVALTTLDQLLAAIAAGRWPNE